MFQLTSRTGGLRCSSVVPIFECADQVEARAVPLVGERDIDVWIAGGAVGWAAGDDSGTAHPCRLVLERARSGVYQSVPRMRSSITIPWMYAGATMCWIGAGERRGTRPRAASRSTHLITNMIRFINRHRPDTR